MKIIRSLGSNDYLISMKTSLSAKALAIIDKYRHLPLAGKLIVTPYSKNRLGLRMGYRVYLGKAAPDELIAEIYSLAREKKFDLDKADPEQIRVFMEKNSLGIDCSGFITQVLDALDPKLVRAMARRDFWRNPYRYLVARLRPFENLSIAHLTAPRNAYKLKDLSIVMPGDIIRTRKGRHGMLITAVSRDESRQELKSIEYAHSTSYYGQQHGVSVSKIKIVYPHESLRDQDWREQDEQGRNYTLEGFLEDDGDLRSRYLSLVFNFLFLFFYV